MYQKSTDYLQWLVNMAGKYGMDTHDMQAISLVGFNLHMLADINDTVAFNTRQAIKESHVITANKLDSLYKHAREVGIFPTLSRPAHMKFIMIITEEEFDRVATFTRTHKSYILSKSNYVQVGDFIYSLDYDIQITATLNTNTTSMDVDDHVGYVHAEYLVDSYLPDSLNDLVNPTIKVVRRKTVRGWEYNLYLTLKQYSREIYEREFQDRDYALFNYTASGELADVKCYREFTKQSSRDIDIEPLAIKMYFENSRTSRNSIFMQFESTNTFSMIYKSQENGFRAKTSDKLITHIFTTAGSKGNFNYARLMGDDINFITDNDTDVDIQIILEDGKSEQGKSFTKDKETLRREIITKRSTRDAITTENDILMHINNIAANNEHYVIKYRNDIRKIFNVFTTLKYYTTQGKEYYIPTNTLNIRWDLNEVSNVTITDSPEAGVEYWYNLNSYMVKANENIAEVIIPNEKDFVLPTLEEYRLGLTDLKYSNNGNTLNVGEGTQIPVLHNGTESISKGVTYYYNGRLYRANYGRDKLATGEALSLLHNESTFETINDLYYWMPYHMVYVRSDRKNYIQVYDQIMDKKYNLDYHLDNKLAPYSFICNWVKFEKLSLFNEYNIKMHVRNNMTDFTLDQDVLFAANNDGSVRVIDTNKLQAFLVLYDENDREVYRSKFKLNEYSKIEANNDDFIEYKLNILPAGFIPKIVSNKITIWSDLQQKWIRVNLTNLKAEIKLYKIDDNPKDKIADVVKLVDAYSKSEELVDVTIYKDLDISDKANQKYLVNHYNTTCDLFNDLNSLFKVQHKIINTTIKSEDGNQSAVIPVLEIQQAPVVQYAFYKNFAYLYHQALKDEFNLEQLATHCQGEFSLALKFTNTYGFSNYYIVGKQGSGGGITTRRLNNVQLDMSFLIHFKYDEDNDQNLESLSYAVAKYIESINFLNYDTFHISRLYDFLFDNYGSVVDFIEFIDINGIRKNNQLISMNIDRIQNDTVIEKINIPYSYNDKFVYKVNWRIHKSIKKDKK